MTTTFCSKCSRRAGLAKLSVANGKLLCESCAATIEDGDLASLKPLGRYFLAYDPEVGTEVLIKPFWSLPPDTAERFARNLRVLARLTSPNIVRLIRYDPQHHYLVEEFCPDGSLADLLMRRPSLPLAESVSIIREVCRALEVAHNHGPPILHLNITPRNILFKGGIVKVSDFGMARMIGGGASPIRTRGMMGTVGYASPEALRDASKADVRADMWAVGVILYEMLTWSHPFSKPGDEFVDVAMRVWREPPFDPPYAIPTPVWEVIVRALEKEPEKRFASAGEMIRALDQAVESIPAADSLVLPPEEALGELDRVARQVADSLSSGSLGDAQTLVLRMKEMSPECGLVRYWEKRIREQRGEA